MDQSHIKRIVIVGATSSIAEHCARLWVTRGAVEMILVGRDLERTERIAVDLRVRNPAARIETIVAGFVDPLAIQSLVRVIATRGAIDIALIAHGSLPDQNECEQELAACDEALTINGVSPALFAEAFAGAMQSAGHGSLIIIGSVAGDRGRKSNYVYGSAKGLVDRYAQGLQHRLAATNVRVTLVKPGPTDTPMTAHLKASGGKLAKVDDVARQIVDGAASGKPVIYAPGKWALIMLVIRHLPRFVFNRMNI
jgi:decaprenylphospho-beta-D-erythro-pentofuranosid-2-ulose 2-reductase